LVPGLVSTPEPIPVPQPSGDDSLEAGPDELEHPIPVPPARPPRNRFPIALAAGGGAAVLGIVLLAYLFGRGGGGGSASPESGSAAGSDSPSGSQSASESPSGGSPSASIDIPPGGHGILFEFDEDPRGENDSEIYLIDPETLDAEPLTNNDVEDRWPRWSPDGTLIVFTRFVGNSSHIWLMDAQGNNERRLTNGSHDDATPDITDEGVVAFTSNRDETDKRLRDVWVINEDKSGLDLVVGKPGFDDSGPAWSPDGQRMVFTTNREAKDRRAIYMYDGGDPQPVKSGNTFYRNPRWHPTEERLVYTRNPVGTTGERDVWSLDLASEVETPISEDPRDEGAPVYSPKGTQIAFFRKDLDEDQWHIWIRDVASGDEHDITDDLEGNSIDPSWR
jgi:Tol biopolymer transport system component